MNVVHIIQRYPPAVGGSEQWCREVSRYLAATGEQVKVLTLNVLEEEEYWRDPPVPTTTRRLGPLDWDGPVQVRRYRRSLPTALVRSVEKFLRRRLGIHFGGPHSLEMYGRMFREIRAADVVHLNTLPYSHNYVGLLAAKLFGKRVVITPHFHPGHPDHEARSNFWVLRHCDVVFTDSAYERDYLVARGVDPARAVVTGAGIHPHDYVPSDLDTFAGEIRATHGLAPSTRIVIFVGRKTGYKGLPALVEAVRRVKARHDVVLFLVGPSMDWFDSFYACLPDEDKRVIIDLGAVTHTAKVNLLHMADVLVLPSPFEAFGIVFLEAWACGTPVIGTDSPAVAELVEGGGLTFEAKNTEDLAAKLDTLLTDPPLAASMARRGLDKVMDRYQWTTVGAAVRRAYQGRGNGGLRILICSNLFPPHSVGGSEVVAYKQGSVLRRIGHDVRVFAGRLGPPRQRYRVTTETRDFHTTWMSITPEDLGGHAQRLVNADAEREFSRVLDEFRPDVVHFHNVTGLSIAVIAACRRRGIPTVMTLHDYWGVCFKNLMIKNDGSLCATGGFDCLGCAEVLAGAPLLPSPVRNGHILLALRTVDRFISPSHYLAERFAANGLPADRMHVIRNGIDFERFGAAPRRNGGNGGFTIGYIGQLIKHKGVEILLRSLAFMSEDIQLIVVGDGEQGGHLRELCRELDLDRRVTFAGLVDNRRIAKFYEKMDVVIVPSVWPENSPVVITEAMASGIPVVASDIGGIPELVEDGITGFLIPPRNIRALAERVEYLHAHPEERRQMGAKATERIREHELGQQVAEVLEVYKGVVNRERGERPDLGPEIILYHGANDWDFPLRDLIHQVASLDRERARRLVVCRVDLVGPETIDEAKLMIVPSANRDSFQHACEALGRGLPLVVHETVRELRELCIASKAGLFYAGRDELRACLDLLLSDGALYEAMSANGRAFIAAAGSS